VPDFNDGSDQARYEYQGQVNPNDPSLANGGISLAEWQAYQAKRKKDALLGVLGILGATTGLGALGAMGGASGAAASGALPAIEGGAPWAVTPYAGTASMVPSGAAAVGGSVGAGAAGAAAGAGAGGASAAGAGGFLGMSAKELMALALGTAGTIGGAMADKPNMEPNTATKDPQLQELLSLMSGRLKKSEPMFDSVQSMANGLLPTQYQNGGRGGQSNG
jgi:hypothetical protein